MDTSPIPGFITRKQASERCQRAERTLQRYWSRAVGLRDLKVLQHLKLWTEDGKVIEGPDVTKERIEQLKEERQNPTWYVDATWADKTYSPRPPDGAVQTPEAKPAAERGDLDVPDAVAALLRQQIQDLQHDKEELREELRIKNQQINDANEREKETNILMRDLHRLMSDMQQRLLPAPQGALYPTSGEQSIVEAGEAPTARPRAKPAHTRKRGERRPAPVASPLAKSMPTFTRLARRIFHR
jgi:hypothetical protein